MKLLKLDFRAQLAAALLIAGAISTSAEPVLYQARPGSKLKIDGTSTVHDWTVETKIIGGFIEFDSPVALDPAKEDAKVTPKVKVTVPVSSIKSGKSLMDDIMHDAMKIKEFPRVEYELKDLTPKAGRKAGDPLDYEAKGDLTVAGVKKSITMPVTLVPDGDKLKAIGKAKVKMTDFGIKPPAPSVGLGLIKTADDVTITFEWNTAKAEKKAASAK